MWPPVNGHLSPLTPTTAQVPLNVQHDSQGTVQTRSRRCRSERRVARSEPLYRRIDIRQQPYLISSISQRHKKLDILPEEELALDLRITTDDIQAATILMLFAKRLLIYNEQTRSSSPTLECALTASEDKRVTENAQSDWLQALLCRQSRQRLLRILQGLSNPRFALPRDQSWWKSETNVNLVASCMTLRRMAPSAPAPWALLRAMHVAEQLVEHARLQKMPDDRHICCPDCGALPALPVTGPCGHTRCLECAKNNASCPCGVPAPQEMHVDTCVQYLIGKLLANKQPSRAASRTPERSPVNGHLLHEFVRTIYTMVTQENCQALARRRTVAQRLSRGLRVSLTISPDSFTAPDVPARLPMTPQARLLHACELIGRQCYLEAAAHLARAAAHPGSELARRLLVQTLAILLEGQEPERVARAVGGAVRAQAAAAWLAAADLECALCRDTLVAPVATPCGHTYCRGCIELSMDYRRACPLCLRDLAHFNLSLTRKSQFVCAALASINMLHSPPPLDPSSVPVFVCVTAFPKMSCPLLITLPRYRVLIRRILEAGAPRLGMVALNEDHSYSDYGTMLEVRDCIECDDGRMFLSTIGISRFKIVEKVMDSCFARVEPVTDEVPTEPATLRALRVLGAEVAGAARAWLKTLRAAVRAKIEQACGRMPPYSDTEWWRSPDGPDWLWWLVASLPLDPELKDMMISNCWLLTRLRMTLRSLKLAMSSASDQLC